MCGFRDKNLDGRFYNFSINFDLDNIIVIPIPSPNLIDDSCSNSITFQGKLEKFSILFFKNSC